MFNSVAITKIQSVILISIITVAAVGGTIAYVLLNEEAPAETIRIGVCADIDNIIGKQIWQGAVLAAEQVNAEGGVLGRKLEIVAEDDDSELGGDADVAISALNRLISVDEADFIITSHGVPSSFLYQEKMVNHNVIHFFVNANSNNLTQNVLENYEKYKCSFRTGPGNRTSIFQFFADSMVGCRMHTGFNKVAVLFHWFMASEMPNIVNILEDHGFEVVLSDSVHATVDLSSYFAHAEAAEAEILFPVIWSAGAIPFVKEYYDRQSPMVMWGKVFGAERNAFWEETGAKCEHITSSGQPIVSGYPLTSITLLTREAYFERWDQEISSEAAVAYDTVRFILAEAIKRAGTIETEAVIKSLEETDLETSLARRFVFTSSHDVMIGEDYCALGMFQWQNGVQVPVYPTEFMDDVGATYKFPDWPGPWD